MSGVQSVSTERLNSLLGHVTHRGFDDLVDPKNQGIAYPTGNPDLLVLYESTGYRNHIFVKSKRSLLIISSDLFDITAKTYPSTTRCSLLALKSLTNLPSSLKFKETSGSLELWVML
jgi:hypothetical protein